MERGATTKQAANKEAAAAVRTLQATAVDKASRTQAVFAMSPAEHAQAALLPSRNVSHVVNAGPAITRQPGAPCSSHGGHSAPPPPSGGGSGGGNAGPSGGNSDGGPTTNHKQPSK